MGGAKEEWAHRLRLGDDVLQLSCAAVDGCALAEQLPRGAHKLHRSPGRAAPAHLAAAGLDLLRQFVDVRRRHPKVTKALASGWQNGSTWRRMPGGSAACAHALLRASPCVPPDVPTSPMSYDSTP